MLPLVYPIRWKPFYIPLILFTLHVCTPCSTTAQDKPPVPLSEKNVLVLHSFAYAQPAYKIIDEALITSFVAAGLDFNKLHFAFLDLSRHPGEEYRKELVEIFRTRFKGRKLDLVLMVHQTGLKFLLNEGQDIYPEGPIISILDEQDVEHSDPKRPLICLRAWTDATLTGKNILSLKPDTQKILLVAGSSDHDRRFSGWAMDQLKKWNGALEVEIIAPLPLADVLKTVSQQPSKTAILYTTYSADTTGKNYIPADVARMISKAANVPVFGLFETLLGDNGVVGGTMMDHRVEAERAVRSAMEVLQGNLPISPVTILKAPLFPMFDWQQMERWGFKESALPADAIILNKRVSPWEMYKFYVIGGLAFILVESLLIAGLLIQKRRRRSAEESLRRKTTELNQFFSVTLELLCVANTDGYFMVLNPAWEKVLGYSSEELKAKPLLDFVHPDDRNATLQTISTLATQQEITHFENRYRCKDGTYRWLEWTSVPAGQLIYAGARDITERKEAEAKLNAQLAFERLLADVSARFVNLPHDQIDHVIEDTHRIVCERLGLDQSGLWEFSARNPNLVLTHLHRPLGGPPVPERMEAQEYFPWCLQQVRSGKTIVLDSIENAPAEAARDQEGWRYYGVKSTVVFPLSAGGDLPIGALSFDAMREERAWPEPFVRQIQLLVQVFANALARKRADSDLREREARLNLATNAAGAGLWVMEIDTGEVWVSPKTREQFHFGPDEKLTFESYFRVIHPDDHERVRMVVQRTIQSGEDLLVDFRIVRPDGSTRWISARGQRDPSTEPVRLMGVSLDITDRKLAAEALRESEERFRQVAESVSDFVWEVDAEGLYLYTSPSVERILGYTSDELIGKKHFYDLFVPESREELKAAALTAFAAKEPFRNYPNQNLSKDGRVVHLETSGTPMLDDGGTLLGYRGADTDVTERKKAEKALAESQAQILALFTARMT